MSTINNENPELEVIISIPPPALDQLPKIGTQCTKSELDSKPINNPEISKYSPNPIKTPKYPIPTFKAKPKSRIGLEILGSPRFEQHNSGFPSEISQEHLLAKEELEERPDEDEEEEICRKIAARLSAKRTRRMTFKLVLELFVFLLILGCLVSSLTIKPFKAKPFYGLALWEWFVLLMVIFSGMLVTYWVVEIFVLLIEWKFFWKKNVLYFTYGLKTSVQGFIWIGLVLGTWVLLVRPDVRRTLKSKKILDLVTWTLVSMLIGAFLWLLKTTLIKYLASSFQLNRYFERIKEAIFHLYVLQTLSGQPGPGLGTISREEIMNTRKGESRVRIHNEKKFADDWEKIHKMKKEKVPSRTMQLLVDVISRSGFSTMSDMLKLNKGVIEGGVRLDDDEITSEKEAIATAVDIFRNVVGDGQKDAEYIDRSHLLRFMIREEVNLVYPLLGFNDKGQITKNAFTKWVVKVYKDRQALQHTLNDNKTAVNQLNKLLIGILIIIIIILWLLLTEIVSTKFLLFISSQLVLAAFVFGNSCKTMFEGLVFVFVMHPFDVGDRCVIDGNIMVVEEMNILTTVFLKPDNEKLYYPNSVLATQAIGNYFRSPDQGDTFEFEIDYSTPLSTIADLKEQIKQYLVNNSHYWHPDHSLVVKDIENINTIKMALFFNHTINFQEYSEKRRRRSELVLKMKSIFDELKITCDILPSQIYSIPKKKLV